MSARRRRIVGVERAGEVPSVLLADAVDDPLWSDPGAVWQWCEGHGVRFPEALRTYDYTRPGGAVVLRNDVALAWARARFPSERFPKLPDWGKVASSGIGRLEGARLRRRFLLSPEHQNRSARRPR